MTEQFLFPFKKTSNCEVEVMTEGSIRAPGMMKYTSFHISKIFFFFFLVVTILFVNRGFCLVYCEIFFYVISVHGPEDFPICTYCVA